MTSELPEIPEATRTRILIDAMYRKYGRILRDFLRRRRLSQDDVADIVQETFSRVIKSGNVESIRNPKAFLFQIAANVHLNSEKHRKFGIDDGAVEIDRVEVRSDEPGPYRRLKAEQELEIVRAALEELPLPCREAFIMNRFENMSFPQIASELKLSVSMIEKHVARAIAHMRARLEAARAPASRATHHLKSPQ